MTTRQRVVLLHLPKSNPINIDFQDITYTVQCGKEKKQILKGVSGRFQCGELTAIMGPSGAGKSSLLNILTGFQTAGMGGCIKSNGVVRSKSTGAGEIRKESCYIQQDDQLSPLFTVSEMMFLAADLKLGYCLSRKSKQLLIDDILDTIGLAVCRDTRCDRLSGGQRKRLSVALELVDNPPVMFLDEPTSGLDSSSSLQCVSMLKSLARTGRTIVCTIHQPCATLFEMFDHVYALAEGQCVFQGDSRNVVPYLQTVGLNCPQYHNPADYMLEVANGEYGHFTLPLAQAARVKSWRKVQPTTPCIIEETGNNMTPETNKTMVLINPPSEFARFWVLLDRSVIQLYRDWTVSHLKLVLHFVVGILLGLNYYGFGQDGSKTINNVGFFMCTVIYLSYTSMMPSVLKFPQELEILKKEQFNNWYRLRTYYAAFIIANTPLQVLFGIAYLAPAYVLSAQLLEWTRCGMVFGIVVLVNVIAESTGLFLGTVCNPVNGTFFGAVLIAFLLLFSGFLALFNDMSVYVYWMSYMSYMRYSMEGLVIASYGYARQAIPCPETLLYCHYSDPSIILKEMGMEKAEFWTSFGVLAVAIVVMKSITFLLLKRKVTLGQ